MCVRPPTGEPQVKEREAQETNNKLSEEEEKQKKLNQLKIYSKESEPDTTRSRKSHFKADLKVPET